LSLYFKAIAFQAIPLDHSGTPPNFSSRREKIYRKSLIHNKNSEKLDANGMQNVCKNQLVDCQGLEPRMS
jgi:hypothetical protein